MPQSQWDQYLVKDTGQQDQADPFAQYRVTARGTPVPTMPQRPGMPAPPNFIQQEIARRQAGTLAGFPGGSPNVPSDRRAMLPGAVALGAAGAVAAPTAAAAFGAPVVRAAGRAALRHPFLAGAAMEATKHIPPVPTPFGNIDIGKYARMVPEWMEWGPLLYGGGRTLFGKAIEKAAEKAAAEKAAGQVIGGSERELLQKQLGKVLSGEAAPGELRTIGKGLKAGKKAATAAAQAAEEKATSLTEELGMKIKGSMQRGGTVPSTGTYLLHQGEMVLPNFSWAARGQTGDLLAGIGGGPRATTPMSQRQSYYGPTNAPGMIAPGNIDLLNRPRVKNPDGTISTLRSMSIDDENGNSMLIPTVVNGKVVSDRKAVEHYLKTGEHLGKFDNYMNADAHSWRLHVGQDNYYRTNQAYTPLGSFQQGGMVPITGPYQLHQGEQVVPNPRAIPYTPQTPWYQVADPATGVTAQSLGQYGLGAAKAVPPILASQAKSTAKRVYTSSAPNIFHQMYLKFTGQPNRLHEIPKAAVQTFFNQLTAQPDIPGVGEVTKSLAKTEEEMPRVAPQIGSHGGVISDPTPEQLAAAAAQQKLTPVKPLGKTGRELWQDPMELSSAPQRPVGRVARHATRGTIGLQSELPGMEGVGMSRVPQPRPQTGAYPRGAAIPWSPQISQAMVQEGMRRGLTAQQAIQQAERTRQWYESMSGFGVPSSIPLP